jgi:hypothetical protein
MAVDPNTGQTVLNIPGFDQRYAGFLDPTAVSQFATGQNQANTMGSLGRSLMQSGYIPNSGFAGALAQMVQAALGAHMLNKSQEQMGSLYQQQIEAANKAEQAKHAQDLADKKVATDEEIRKALGTKEGETKLALQYGDLTNAQQAKLKAAEAMAVLPAEERKIQLETQGKIQAATAAAEVSNRRGYVVPDASGNSVVITPQGKEIYRATAPGGGKLTPADTALNAADTGALEKLNVRKTAAQQLQQNLVNWTAAYTGSDPKELQGLSPQQLAEKVKSVPSMQAISALNPIGNRGLDAMSNDIAINAAGTKRDTPTEDIIRAEQNNTVSRYKTPTENAAIIANHAHDIAQLQQQIEQTQGRITGRATPGQGRIPAAEAGPMNQPASQPQAAPTQTAINPKTGERIGLVNGQWVPLQ